MAYLYRIVVFFSFAAVFLALANFMHPDGALFDESVTEWLRHHLPNIFFFGFFGILSLQLSELMLFRFVLSMDFPPVRILIWGMIVVGGSAFASLLVIIGGGYLWAACLGMFCGLAASFFWMPVRLRYYSEV
jgi:hypothetical protein